MAPANDYGRKESAIPEGEDENAALNQVSKPSGSKFHQQKLPAWQPLLTAGVAFPLFFIISAIFVPIGAYLYTVNEAAFEISTDYTNCRDQNNLYCMELVSKADYFLNYRVCNCNVTINLAANITGQVYAYYGLTNFYQNHRRYVRSRDDSQLIGSKQSDLLEDCNPYRTEPGSGNWYAPGGAIANSLFNDSFQLLYHHPSAGALPVPWTSSGIAWVSDRERKFGRVANWNGTAKPPSWPLTAKQRSADSFSGDEELMVWMRTAALPNFRKLHRIVLRSANNSHPIFSSGLPAGNYTLRVAYAFPVSSFAGTKSFILATSSWTGGRNPVMAIMYMTVGCVHFLLGIVFVIVHFHASKNIVSGVTELTVAESGLARTVPATAPVANEKLGVADMRRSSAAVVATGNAGKAGAENGNNFATGSSNHGDRGAEGHVGGGGGFGGGDGDGGGAGGAVVDHREAPVSNRPRNMLQSLTLADY